MIVPLGYRDYYLGDLSVRLTPHQTVEVPIGDLGGAIRELVRPDTLRELHAVSQGQDYVTLTKLRDAGFDFRFDPAAVNITFAPTLDQKVEGNISVQARKAVPDSSNVAEPAKLAAFLNIRGVAEYVGKSPAGQEGMTIPRLNLEGAASWRGIVVEAEATYEPDDVSIFHRSGNGFKRRGTRLIRDFQAEAIRVSAGDIYPAGAAMQSTPDLLGVSVERSYRMLQPGRNIRPTSRRSFRIKRPSNVDVEINGVIERRLKLDPGDYSLSDLPIRSGLNEIVLLISDDAGAQERLVFSVFHDGALLEPGLSEWAVSGGVLSSYDRGEPDYGDHYFGTGYYRQGIAETITAEAHLQGGAGYGLAGLGLVYGSSLGLFALKGAASVVGEEQWGLAVEAYYSPPVWTDTYDRNHAFQFTIRGRSHDYTGSILHAPESREVVASHHDRWLDLSARYHTEIPFEISTFLAAGYGFGFAASDDRFHADAGLSRSFGTEVNLGVTAGYSAALHREDDDDLSLQFRMNYRPDIDSALGFSYDPAAHRTRASYTRRYGRGGDSWYVRGDISHEAADNENFDPVFSNYTVDGLIQHSGNRGLIGVYQTTRFAGLDEEALDQRTSLRVETAIAYADGVFALGRPVADGFAIVAPHSGLSGHDITIGRAETAVADRLGPALIPSISPYSLNRVNFDVADLPAGYNLGDGHFDLQPGYRSGYALNVGSAYTVTAIGTLVDNRGEPIALLPGMATEAANPGKVIELFTNRAGRFAAQGLAPGQWLIELAGTPPQRFELVIPDESIGLVRAGALHPLEVRP